MGLCFGILKTTVGTNEIQRCVEQIQSTVALNSENRFMIIPLHGNLNPEEQAKAFLKPSMGVRKVVVSTNVAESSITM